MSFRAILFLPLKAYRPRPLGQLPLRLRISSEVHFMLQSPEPKYAPNAAPANSYAPVKPATSPMDQANIGRSLVIKGEVSGSESLFIDGRAEARISFPENSTTIG